MDRFINSIAAFFARLLPTSVLLVATVARSQFDGRWTHPELQWSTIETEHFYVHFHNGAEYAGKVTAKIAEDIYEPITSLYGYEPDGKVHFIIKDYDDFSNGAAYYLDNKVEIWASALDFELRGTHNWLRNVITHEYTHMISLGAARKITRHLPAFYLQWFGYEDEKRPDVLLGYPNRVVSYPILMTTVPPWFAEGVAQYQLPELEYDRWDSHRDMLLRTAVVENKMLTYSEMGVFAKNSVGSERVYNQGYAFVTYIADHYGVESLRAIAQSMRKVYRFSFDAAIKEVTGKGGSVLYDEWRSSLQEKYGRQLRDIKAHVVAGELVVKEGTGNFFPKWSPDGAAVAYLTNKGADYLGMTALVVRNQTTGKVKTIKAGVRHDFDWSPDGTKLICSRKTEKNPHHSSVYDLYIYDVASGKEERLTQAARAHSPNWSPDGKSIACVLNGDATQNLAVYDLATKQLKLLTNYKHQEQVYSPQWSPDGKRILFGYSKARGRDLLLYDVDSGNVTVLLDDAADSRNAAFSPDGKRIYFSWDKTGIFNIYAMDLESRQLSQLTNVIGGAFMPSVNQQGELVYSTFVAEGYKIAFLERPEPLLPEYTRYPTSHEESLALASRNGNLANLNLSGIKHAAYDDSKIPDYDVKPYRDQFTSISVLPRVTIDYGTAKLGSYFYSSDMLDRYGFIAGVAVNHRKDYDAFLLFDYRKLGPELYLEAFNQALKTTVDGDDIRYNLAEVGVGIRHNFNRQHRSQLGFVYSRYNAKIGFEVRGARQTFAYTYHIGKAVVFDHRYRVQVPAVDGAINPRFGREVHFRYAREYNDLIPTDPEEAFRVTDYGTIAENYEAHNVDRFQLEWTERLAMPGRTGLTLFGRGGLLSRDVDDFFYFFAGGLNGVRGYPYYSMEGRYLAHGRITYRFPLFRHLDYSFSHFYLDKVYLGVSYEYGGAFTKTNGIRRFLHDSVDLQLRLDMYSFYGLPTRLAFSAAYGFDKFTNHGVEYGREWRYYFTVLFDFIDN